MAKWVVRMHREVRTGLQGLRATDRRTLAVIAAAIDHVVGGKGPAEGRPLVDRIKGSKIHNLKELRPASSGATEVRVLFVFDEEQRMVLLAGGDKAGDWERWYDTAIPLAEVRYGEHLDQVHQRAG